jgi:cystathionine beta-lyase/cystathionine gamma-synthase
MSETNIVNTIKNVIENMPEDWLRLTTHRLDIYNESLAKVEFLQQFEKVGAHSREELAKLPTAFDYIRLGHPLSCLLEWAIANNNKIPVDNVISFSSQSMSILAVLRRNLLDNKKTQIVYKDALPEHFDVEVLKSIYSYNFEVNQINSYEEIPSFDGSTVLLTAYEEAWSLQLPKDVDFVVSIHPDLGSVIQINCDDSEKYIKEVLHVRRRESIAMTPHDCLSELKKFVGISLAEVKHASLDDLSETLHKITHTQTMPIVGSSGLSIQYAIMMGLIHYSQQKYPGKEIKFIVPPNCYGGTNDQARRVAACVANVEILDLPVDGGKDMAYELEKVLVQVALTDSVPFIIAEIPTNPRVEIPDLVKLEETLITKRKTSNGSEAVEAVFILDQTFCPNVKFLGVGDYLGRAQAISYVSGSKFPSGGLCTAGYCVANDRAKHLLESIDQHLKITANVATDFQITTLTQQMPSMNERIAKAYKNTREFVNFIEKTLPTAKINFVSEQLASQGFTPSVFSLDLPADNESQKRELNHKLIKMMITEIPQESKHCVSYGQLKGCYWTVPATSTQGTTKEGDKDYIVRVAASADMDVEKHKQVFQKFVDSL